MYALLDEIPRLRAQQMLDAAQASVYPHLTKESAQRWWNGLVQQAQRTVRDAVTTGANNVREVRRWLRGILGAGLSE